MAAVRVLSELQREVLGWVAPGCPAGVYEGFSHRIAARALAGRGLVTIKGRGSAWQAVVTGAGQAYLENGPADTARSPKAPPRRSRSARATHPTDPADVPWESAEAPADGVSVSLPRKAPARVGPVDQMMAVLRENGEQGMHVDYAEEARYRQLAASAKRHGRIPDGMQIELTNVTGARTTRVALVPLPAWQTAVLTPLKVPARLRGSSDVVQALEGSDTFAVEGKARARALRLIEALVTAGRDRGMRVKAATGVQPMDRRGYTSGGPRRDEVRFTIDGDTFGLWFTQGTLDVPHTPTPRELKQASRGHAFPDQDTVPDEHLGIRLDGEGGAFWASSWADTDNHLLEEDLAQMLEEMTLRHGRLVEQRAAEARQHEQRKVEWEKARERALVAHARAYRVSAMKEQAQQWHEAELLRSYAAAIGDRSQGLDIEAQEQAAMWAKRILDHADSIDPLAKTIGLPAVPAPSASDLGPFMRPHNPYGP